MNKTIQCLGEDADNDVSLHSNNENNMNFLTPKELLSKYPNAKDIIEESFIEMLFSNDYLLGRYVGDGDNERIEIEEGSFIDLLNFRDSVIDKKIEIAKKVIEK